MKRNLCYDIYYYKIRYNKIFLRFNEINYKKKLYKI